MKKYQVTVSFMLNGGYHSSDFYEVEVPEDTPEDDEMTALMDAVRPQLNDEYEDDEDWENGCYNWTIIEFEQI